MNSYDFDGRTAIVTGGAQGIGLAVVERMLAGGVAAAIWDRDEALLENLRERFEGDAGGDQRERFPGPVARC